MAQDGIEDGEQFVHAGDESHLLGFAGGAQAAVERTDRWVVTDRGKGRHIQRRAHGCTAAPDNTPATQRSALAGEGRDPNQGGESLAIECTQLGQLSEQGIGGGGADARDATQQVVAFSSERALLDRVAQVTVQVGQFLSQSVDVAADPRPPGRQRRAPPPTLGGEHADDLTTSRQQGRQRLRLSIGQGAHGGADRLGETREELRVKGVGLGELADGARNRAPGAG